MTTPLSRLVTKPRRLRLFVSSTFTDMLEERRLLEREVFPKIRHLCQERAVEFYAVNLAWGIPDDVRLGEVIDVCLREVRECHPFFLGFMSQRYGRIQDRREVKTAEKIDKLVEVHPDLQWLLEHLPASVTDLEIQQALRLGIQKDIMQFYDRDEVYLATLSDAVRFRVKDGQREDLFVEEDSDIQRKLQQLKQQLREA